MVRISEVGKPAPGRNELLVDAAGKSSFGRCKRLLKPGGIYMSTGPGP